MLYNGKHSEHIDINKPSWLANWVGNSISLQLQTHSEIAFRGRHWGKKTTLTTGKKRFTPTLHTGKNNLRHWKKNLRICTLNLFAAEISYSYNICRGWALKHEFCMIFKAFWPWIFEFYLQILQLKSLICTIFAGCWNLIMQFAWYLNRFCLESLVCTLLAASWSQHLYYTGYYLQYFVVFATYCLELVLGSISDWLGCI